VRTWAKSSLYLSVALIAVGFLLIYFGWNGAAEKDFIQGQFPYLLSGGLTGLGFILCGLTLVATQSFRRDVLSLQDRIEELLLQQQGGPSSPGGATLSAVPDLEDGVFVAVGETYHVASCRTVRGRSGLDLVSAEDAEQRGLTACRVCRPAAQSA
jgi:hypothetical protein